MPVTDDQLAHLIRDLSAGVPAPIDLRPQLSARLQRRQRHRRMAFAASTVVLAASVSVAGVFLSRSSSPRPGVVATPVDSGNPAAAQLLGWPTRGDLAADRAYVTSATTTAESVSSNAGTQITHDARALYVGTVPGGRTAAFVEGLDGLGNPMVVALSGIAGHTGFHAYGGAESTTPLDSSAWASDISFALARPDAPGFALVVGAPGTTRIDLSIAPRQHGGTFGPRFRKLPLTEGVGAVRLPAGADPLSVYYTIEGPDAREGFFYATFTSGGGEARAPLK